MNSHHLSAGLDRGRSDFLTKTHTKPSGAEVGRATPCAELAVLVHAEALEASSRLLCSKYQSACTTPKTAMAMSAYRSVDGMCDMRVLPPVPATVKRLAPRHLFTLLRAPAGIWCRACGPSIRRSLPLSFEAALQRAA